MSDQHAVFAVDPGGTTGVAAAYIEPKVTIKETLLSLPVRKSVEVEGDWIEQADQIATMMNEFVYNAHVGAGIPHKRIHFVFEDFVLRMPARTTNLTSVWVIACAVGRYGPMNGVDVAWQSAGDAKSFASDSRLKLWDLWVRGSTHERDAWRHVALRSSSLILGAGISS